MIDYASFDSRNEAAFDCALKITSKLEGRGTSIELNSTMLGIQDCLVHLIISTGFKYLKGTAQYDAFCRSIQDVRNYDIVIEKLSEILTEETVEAFVQALIENGIRNIYKNEK